MTEQLQRNAVIRALLWAGLAVMSLYIGIRLATGPGRDTTFAEVEWTTGAVIQVLAITAGFAAAFGFAAYRTFKREVRAPAGVLRFPGGYLPMFGEAIMAITGALAMLTGIYLIVRVPEAILAGNHPTYAHYHSASVGSALGPALLLLVPGAFLMFVRRSLWEVRAGVPIVRYWSRWLGRPQPVPQEVMLYWDRWWAGRGAFRRPVAWCLHGAISTRRHCEIVLVSLATPPAILEQLRAEWQQRLAGMTAGHHRIVARSPYEPVAPAANAVSLAS